VTFALKTLSTYIRLALQKRRLSISLQIYTRCTRGNPGTLMKEAHDVLNNGELFHATERKTQYRWGNNVSSSQPGLQIRHNRDSNPRKLFWGIDGQSKRYETRQRCKNIPGNRVRALSPADIKTYDKAAGGWALVAHTLEAETRRIEAGGQSEQIVHKTPSRKYPA
jgi:hypothetical protein